MRRFVLILFLSLASFSLCALSALAQSPAPIPLPIVMYHHVSPDPNACGDYTVSTESLTQDFAYLQERGYRSVSLADLRAFVRGEADLPEKSVMITFDDGQESFLAYVLPLLEAYDFSAVCAIIGTCADAYTKVSDHHLSYSYLSWEEIQDLSRSPHVEFSLHTQNMHNIEARKGCQIKAGETTEVYKQRFSEDLAQLEAGFAKYTGDIPRAFAYPYGFECPEALEVLQTRGYDILFTCHDRVNQLQGKAEDLLSLGRFNRPYTADRQQFFQSMGIF